MTAFSHFYFLPNSNHFIYFLLHSNPGYTIMLGNLFIVRFYLDSMPSVSSFLKSIPKAGVSCFNVSCK